MSSRSIFIQFKLLKYSLHQIQFIVSFYTYANYKDKLTQFILFHKVPTRIIKTFESD